MKQAQVHDNCSMPRGHHSNIMKIHSEKNFTLGQLHYDLRVPEMNALPTQDMLPIDSLTELSCNDNIQTHFKSTNLGPQMKQTKCKSSRSFGQRHREKPHLISTSKWWRRSRCCINTCSPRLLVTCLLVLVSCVDARSTNRDHHRTNLSTNSPRRHTDYIPELKPRVPIEPLHQYRIFLQTGVSNAPLFISLFYLVLSIFSISISCP